MKAVIQRVSKAQVKVGSKVISQINSGLLILLGVSQKDDQKTAITLAQKIAKLRIMPDDSNKMNLSVKDARGEILVVSQFTLLANTQKGNRPSFISAAHPEKAKKIYELFIDQFSKLNIPVKTGKFGAFMEINLINNGPVTIVLNA